MIYRRYRHLTMINPITYARNLALCAVAAPAQGCIVECGVWRGGASAGMADILPGRRHYLFDSFEGLPPAHSALDGDGAVAWQQRPAGQTWNNCAAERGFAEGAMQKSAAKGFRLVEGWFADTLVGFEPGEPIAVLRLDGDWYGSTMQCLTALFPYVLPGGLIILDDYYFWDGCSRAVHDFLSRTEARERIEQRGRLCFMVKR
jgi:O-methyltransferase